MKEFILPPMGLLVVLVVIGLIVGVQFVALAVTEEFTKVYEGPSTFKSWSKSGDYVRLSLYYNGKEAWTKNTEVILGYLAKPGPLTCSV